MAKLKSLRLQAYDFVLDRIKDGYYQSGEKISEEDLMEELGVSRTPIKEALLLLTANGILDNQSRRGFFVRNLDKNAILENNDIIGHLDSFAVELVVDLVTKEDLEAMEALAKVIDEALDEQDLAKYDKAQKEFHDIYRRRCPNKQLLELIEQLHSKYVDTVSLSVDIESLIEMSRVCNDQHYKMIELFRNRDQQALTSLVIEHWRTPYVNTFGLK